MKDYSPWKHAVMWYCVPAITRFRKMERAEVKTIANAASDLNMIEPMHMTAKRFEIPGYGADLSGAQVVAILVSGIWCLCGEDVDIAGAMVHDWPDLPMFAKLA